MSFLGLEGYHVFVTGAAGGIGSQVVKEFLGMSVLEIAVPNLLKIPIFFLLQEWGEACPLPLETCLKRFEYAFRVTSHISRVAL